MDYSLYIGKSFNTYECLITFVSEYEKRNFCQLIRRTSIKSASPLQYTKILYVCKASGKPDSKSNGIRRARSFKCDCKFQFTVLLKREKLVITDIVGAHNCQLAGNSEIYSALPRQRRPDNNLKRTIIDVKECGGKSKALVASIHNKHNIFITRKDIANIVQKANKEANMRSLTKLESLIEQMKSYDGSTVLIGHEDNVADVIFFQDRYMKNLYECSPVL